LDEYPGYDSTINLFLKPLHFTFSEPLLLSLADFGSGFANVGPLIEAMTQMKEQAATKLEELISTGKEKNQSSNASKTVLTKMHITVEAPIITIPAKVYFLSFLFIYLFFNFSNFSNE